MIYCMIWAVGAYLGVSRRSPALLSSVHESSRMQTKESKSAIETAIDSAKETCESGSAGACATAWDEVWKAHFQTCILPTEL